MTLSVKSYEGYAENYGPTLEQVYRRAAVILWLRENHFGMMAQKGPKAAISALGDYFDRYLATRDEGIRKECREFAGVIIDYWEPQPYMMTGENLPSHSEILEILIKLEDPGLIARFIEKVMYVNISGEEGSYLAKAGALWGWDSLAVLINVPKRLEQDRSESLASLLKTLCIGDGTPHRGIQTCKEQCTGQKC